MDRAIVKKLSIFSVDLALSQCARPGQARSVSNDATITTWLRLALIMQRQSPAFTPNNFNIPDNKLLSTIFITRECYGTFVLGQTLAAGQKQRNHHFRKQPRNSGTKGIEMETIKQGLSRRDHVLNQFLTQGIKRDFIGNYSCSAINDIGQGFSNTLSLDIKCKNIAKISFV